MTDDLSLDGLPEETVKYIKQLRQEAAGYRTERNSLQSKYDDAGTLLKKANDRLDEFSAMETQLETVVKEKTEYSTKYDKLRAAAQHGIPDEVDRLQGSTYDEWVKDAEALAGKIKPGKTLPKDPAAGTKTPAVKNDPITEAFRVDGWL